MSASGHDELRPGRLEHIVHRENMVKVRVRQQNVLDRELFLRDCVQNGLRVVARVDDRGLARRFVIYDISNSCRQRRQ